MHLALFQPGIPQNVGSIGRQCVGMDAELHLIGPLTFDLDQKRVRRAGLDYWAHLKLTVHPSPEDFLDWVDAGPRRVWAVTKFSERRYDRADFHEDDVLLFGNENTGLPDTWRRRFSECSIHVPILGEVRSYNLSNTVAIVLAEARRVSGAFDRHAHRPRPETPGHIPKNASRRAP